MFFFFYKIIGFEVFVEKWIFVSIAKNEAQKRITANVQFVEMYFFVRINIHTWTLKTINFWERYKSHNQKISLLFVFRRLNFYTFNFFRFFFISTLERLRFIIICCLLMLQVYSKPIIIQTWSSSSIFLCFNFYTHLSLVSRNIIASFKQL